MRKPLIPPRRFFTLFLIVAFGLLLFTVKFKLGSKYIRSTPETRASEVGFKSCYTNQDIEYIVFGEIKE